MVYYELCQLHLHLQAQNYILHLTLTTLDLLKPYNTISKFTIFLNTRHLKNGGTCIGCPCERVFELVKAVIDITRKSCRTTKHHDNPTLMMLNMLKKYQTYDSANNVYSMKSNKILFSHLKGKLFFVSQIEIPLSVFCK